MNCNNLMSKINSVYQEIEEGASLNISFTLSDRSKLTYRIERTAETLDYPSDFCKVGDNIICHHKRSESGVYTETFINTDRIIKVIFVRAGPVKDAKKDKT